LCSYQLQAPDVLGAICGGGENECVPGKVFPLGSGAATGKCIQSTQQIGVKVCEVAAWCPVEINCLV
jgi:hypothetical protein